MEKEKNFVMYDYITKEVPSAKVAMYQDAYESFGWEITSNNRGFGDMNTVTFRRDRKIVNKQELNKLQKRIDDSFTNIDKLERQKTAKGLISSLVLGIIGTLILGGGMSLCLLNPDSLPLFIAGIAIGLVGLAVCGVTYPIYTVSARKRTAVLNPIIEEQYDTVANLCEEAYALSK